MDKVVTDRLIFSILKWLEGQLEGRDNVALSSEGAESVEVAMQCLETAFGVSLDQTHLGVTRSLSDIFYDATRDEPKVSSSSSMSRPLAATAPPADEASTEDKGEAEVLKNEGNQLMREEQFKEAINCYTKAIAKDGSNAVYHCNRAAAHSKLGNHNEAIADCSRALEIEPNYSKAYGRMGLAFSSLNNDARAKECYEKAIEIEPDNDTYKSNLLIADEKLKQTPAQPTNPFAAMNEFAAMGGPGGINFPGLSSLAAGMGGGGAGAPDLNAVFNNPALISMASQLVADPNIQGMMSNLLSGGLAPGGVPVAPGAPAPVAPPAGGVTAPLPTDDADRPAGSIEALLNAGRQLAEQMQQQNPELVEIIRQQMHRADPGNPDGPPAGQNDPST